MSLFGGRGLKSEIGGRPWQAFLVLVPALLTAGAGAARAQTASSVPVNCSGTVTYGANPVLNLAFLGSSAGAVSSTIAGVVGNVNTAFLGQQGSAFVAAPGDPAPDQAGAGVWARALAGEVTTRSVTSNNGVGAQGNLGNNLQTSCHNSVQQFYSGMQVGTDLSRLNINGWNIHVGATAGYLGSTATDGSAGNGGLRTTVEVPFLGGYAAVTRGAFFADLMVRGDFYNLNLAGPAYGLANQPMGAHSLSVSASAGYKFALADNYFIEPSAGFVWSNTKVDPINTSVPNGSDLVSGTPLRGTISGTVATSDVQSRIGRLSLRAGTTISTSNVVYQPFVSASVFHEFAGDVRSSYSYCPGCIEVVAPDGTISPAQYSQQSRTSRVGTYGQFSAGVTAQIVDTGWLGFVRADYRTGGNIDGYAGNIGLRYQFTPDAAPSLRFAKAPPGAEVARGTTDWSGFYLGAFAGASAGRTDITFAAAPARGNTSPFTSGAIGGLQAGYNHQINNWVLGVEGELGFAGLNGARPCGTSTGDAVSPFDPYYQTCKDRMTWSGILAGRLGYATGRTLFYGKAGVAWADGQVNVNCTDGTPLDAAAIGNCVNPSGNRYPNAMPMYYATGDGYRTSADFSRLGWMVGLGTEFDLGRNWSAKAEYDYISFGSQTVTASDGQTRLTSRNALNQVKIGLNYRFGGNGSARDGAPLFVKAADVAKIRDWRGVYFGGNVAAAIASTNNEMLYPSWTPTGGSGYANVGGLAASGASIGGQLGYRAQAGRVVYGVEAQGNWASLSGRNTSGVDADFYRSWTSQTKIDGVGVFTGQLGATISDALFYVKGGAIVASERSDLFENTGNYFVPPDTFHPNQTTHVGSDRATRWGGALGAGAEYGFSPNWSAGIDYVHGFLGTRSYDMAAVNGTGVYASMRTRQSLDMVSLRVNYSFAAK